MLKITSRDNKKLKNTRKVRDDRVNNQIFIEGSRLVSEALKSNLNFCEIFVSEKFFANKDNSSLLDKCKSANLDMFLLSEKLFNSLADTKSSQGVILITEQPHSGRDLIQSIIDEKNRTKSIILLLHEINNPSNLGAILRTAEASGVLGVLATKSSTKAFSPKAIRSSMGAIFRVPIWENLEFDEAIEFAKLNKLTTICADINAQKSYLDADWNKNYLLVFGSEAQGLKASEFDEIDEQILIPMENNVESLNLSIASGIILFEAKK